MLTKGRYVHRNRSDFRDAVDDSCKGVDDLYEPFPQQLQEPQGGREEASEVGGLLGHARGEEDVCSLGALKARRERKGCLPLHNFFFYPLLLVLLSSHTCAENEHAS